MEFGGIGEGGELSKKSEGMAEIIRDDRRERVISGGSGGEELRLLD